MERRIETERLIFMKSNKTLDEALEFFESDVKAEKLTPKRRGGRRKKTSN